MTGATYWHVRVTRDDLIEAIGYARARVTLRKKKGIALEPDVIITAGADGVSIRSSDVGYDIPATGEWASPIRANGAVLRRLAPKLTGAEVELRYETGRLLLNGTGVPAQEV